MPEQKQKSTEIQPVPMRPGSGRPGMQFTPPPKLKDAKGTLRRLLSYMGEKRNSIIIVAVASVISTVTGIIGTKMNGTIIDETITTGDPKKLTSVCLVLLTIYLVGVITSQIQKYLMIDVSQNTITKLRKDLFEHLQELPVRFFDRNSHGDIMSRFTNDVENINLTLSQSVDQFFGDIIAVVGIFIAMILLSPLLTLVSVITIPLMIFTTRKIAKGTRKYFNAQQKILGELNGYIEETISGQRVIKVFNREDTVKTEFSEINHRLQKDGALAQIYSSLIGPVMNLINNLAYAMVTMFGAWLVIRGNSGVTIGVVFSFLLYMRQFSRPVNEIATLFNTIQSALAGAERIFNVIDEAPEEEDLPDAQELTQVTGAVKAKEVFFSYLPERPVLKQASFEASPGQTIALVGPTGAGKTTIVNLLTRFYDVDSGSISIDGLKLNRIKRDDLRKSLGIVLQDTNLFSESVRENIRYGRLDATDEEVETAAHLAYADPFIQRLPNGYDTILSDDGGNLSQGQRQLLSIARVILANPSILILDEATSSVDTRTEVHIQKAMLELMRGRTSFVIAHRLSTIRNADQILVINDGEIIERGSHNQLMEKQGFYAQLQNSQRKSGLAI